MKVPPFYTGIIVLFWGFETKNMLISILIFLILESSFFIKKRWEFEINDFVKISDLTSLILISVVTFTVLNNEIEPALLIIQKLLPIIFSPIILTQFYHVGDKIIIATKLGQSKKPAYSHNPMNFKFIYIALTVLSAASANNRGYHFQIVLMILVFWFLFYNKKKSHLIVFIFTFLSAAGLSFILNNHADISYKYINNKFSNFWKDQYSNKITDPYRSLTTIGNIGKIKNSGTIIMRVKTKYLPPRYLKTASYNIYFSTNWFSKEKSFKTIKADVNSWNLTENRNPVKPANTGIVKTLSIEKYLNSIQTLLPVPYGCLTVESSDISKFEINTNKIIRLETESNIIIYKSMYKKMIVKTRPIPQKADLEIPKKELGTLKRIINDLNISDLSDKEKLNRIKTFFNKDFSYTLDLKEGNNISSISNFLLNTKTGHCEYYATATALLLRAVDIPTKYINGFVIDEKSFFSDKYIVRERHAHAWVEAYINNSWKIIDTTPAVWLENDKTKTSSFEIVSDLFSFLKNKVGIFLKKNKKLKNIILFSVLAILVLILIIRILLRIKKKKRSLIKKKHSYTPKPDSEFNLIIKYLKKYMTKKKNENIISWINRINKDYPLDINTLTPIIKTHQKYRFDPDGLTEKERLDFKHKVQNWLKSHQIQ